MLTVDGSKVMLPNNKETCAAFGTMMYTNGKNKQPLGEHCYCRASVLYDLLNRIAVDATLASIKAYEVDLAIAHLQHPRQRFIAHESQLPVLPHDGRTQPTARGEL